MMNLVKLKYVIPIWIVGMYMIIYPTNHFDYEYDLIICGDRFFFPQNSDWNGDTATIFIKNGVIHSVGLDMNCSDQFYMVSRHVIEVPKGSVVFPGLIDPHVHVNEPGRGNWETFRTATKAAAKGGTTTIIDMPLNSIPVRTTVQAIQWAINAAEGSIYVDTGFWGGVVPENKDELENIADRFGVFGFKAFMCFSGIDEFPESDEEVLRNAIEKLGKHGLPLLVHAEYSEPILNDAPISNYMEYLATKPPRLEETAIETIISLLREIPNGRVHIVHLSDATSSTVIKKAIDEGLDLTAETCPHYLSFEAENIPEGDTMYKVAPPIRDAKNKNKLWENLMNEKIFYIASDHSPSSIDLKMLETGDFVKAWGGIGGVQLRLPVVWTEAKSRGISLMNIMKWLSENAADFLGLDNKGKIEPGYDADFVIWNPDESFTVSEPMMETKVKKTPYNGKEYYGVIEKTILRGKVIYIRDHEFSTPTGRLLFKNEITEFKHTQRDEA